MRKLGLIAGGGRLPFEVAGWCEKAGRPFHVARLRGFANPDLARFPGLEVGIAEFGKCVDALKKAGCEAVCFAGIVTRPDFGALKPDLKGLTILPGAIAAARNGDDALLRFLLQQFEKEGFKVEGATDVMHGLAVGPGTLGHVRPSRSQHADLGKALEIAAAVGRMDAGQGAVVCDGLVLAIEAQEGTDAMLARVAELPAHLRGRPGEGVGVLAKAPKPIQETRVDLPTIGPATVQGVARAGLAGIVGEAGRVLVLERETVVKLADELGVFVVGVEPEG